MTLKNKDAGIEIHASIDKFIAAAIQIAVAEEREACAALCVTKNGAGISRLGQHPDHAYFLGRTDQADSDAAAIRARGNA